MDVTLRIRRYNPEADEAPHWETYTVPAEPTDRVLDLLHEASHLLHAAARPAGTADTVHVSATTHAFTMTGGLTGEPVRWIPAQEPTR